MKKLFNNKVYISFVILSAIVYVWMIFFGGIGPVNLNTVLIFNIVLVGIIIILNLIFAIIGKNNKPRWIILAIFIILFIFVPIKQEYTYKEKSSYTVEILQYKKNNLLDIITKNQDNISNKQKENEDITINKIKDYAKNLKSFDMEKQINEKGYIDEEDALKIVALSDIKSGIQTYSMKNYIKNYNRSTINLIEDGNNKYWKIDLRNEGGSYIEKAVFEVDYYSGKLLKNNVTMQINVD